MLIIFRAEKCHGYVYKHFSTPGRTALRCNECKKERKKRQNILSAKQRMGHLKLVKQKVIAKKKNIQRQKERLKAEVITAWFSKIFKFMTYNFTKFNYKTLSQYYQTQEVFNFF